MLFPIRLSVKARCGSDIKECAAEAIKLATLLGVPVHFDFNGVSCEVRPHESPCGVVDDYSMRLRSQKATP